MLKKLFAVAALLGAGLVHAFMPQGGTWVVSSEVNGKPGRGLAMDAQNDTLVVQMYAYESNGQSTFYLASGRLQNDRFSAPLMRYSGGRYFGSGPLSGAEAGSPGNVSIRFTSGTTGFITFPNEPEVAISRFNFGYAFAPASLRGIWTLTSFGSEGALADVVEFSQPGGSTSNGNGLMVSPNGLFGCEHQVRGQLAGGVLCVKINTAGQVLRSYFFLYSVNEGEGLAKREGVGADQALIVRRLTTPQSVGTGIAYKSNEEDRAPHPFLSAHIERMATQGFED